MVNEELPGSYQKGYDDGYADALETLTMHFNHNVSDMYKKYKKEVEARNDTN